MNIPLSSSNLSVHAYALRPPEPSANPSSNLPTYTSPLIATGHPAL